MKTSVDALQFRAARIEAEEYEFDPAPLIQAAAAYLGHLQTLQNLLRAAHVNEPHPLSVALKAALHWECTGDFRLWVDGLVAQLSARCDVLNNEKEELRQLGLRHESLGRVEKAAREYWGGYRASTIAEIAGAKGLAKQVLERAVARGRGTDFPVAVYCGGAFQKVTGLDLDSIARLCWNWEGKRE